MNGPILDEAQIQTFLEREFPQLDTGGKCLAIHDLGPGRLTMRLDPDERHLRPGNTISGPSMVMLADVAAYAVILAHIGEVALAVTTSININFLTRPSLGPMLCTCSILKLGKRLAVIDCRITQIGATEPVAQATITYSIPPK
jgi:uncharacterized protein (TIGR00369 family)